MATQKLGALQRISNLLDTQKKNLLFNSILQNLSSAITHLFGCFAQENQIL